MRGRQKIVKATILDIRGESLLHRRDPGEKNVTFYSLKFSSSVFNENLLVTSRPLPCQTWTFTRYCIHNSARLPWFLKSLSYASADCMNLLLSFARHFLSKVCQPPRSQEAHQKPRANCTALVLGRKDINSSFKSINEDIHLLFCIVEVKTCTGTCIDTKGPMQNLSTMMP